MGITVNSGIVKTAAAATGEAQQPIGLESIIDSVVLEVDAGVSASYPGTGTTWKNMALTPNDDSLPSAYDFVFGLSAASSGDTPTFVGAAGSAQSYMSFDGNDLFTLESNTNTTFINQLHKKPDGTDFFIQFTGRTAGNGPAVITGTQNGSGSTGVHLNWNTDEKFVLQVDEGFGGAPEQEIQSSAAYPTSGKDVHVLITHSDSEDRSRVFVNGSPTEGAHAFTETSADADFVLHIGFPEGGSTPLDNGWRIYSVCYGNEYITTAREALIRQHMEDRHGRDYTD